MADVRIQDFNGILHVSGDDPISRVKPIILSKYSPRKWR